MPPPLVGSTSDTASLPPSIRVLRNSMSDNAAYILRPSVAEPHWMPPTVPPLPRRACHNTWPLRSGSSPYAIPDFCPTISARLPFGSVIRMGDWAKSKSGPPESGQLVLSSRKQELFHASFV